MSRRIFMEEYKGENIIIMSCSSCNTKCKHCYISYKGDIEPQKLKQMVNTFKTKYQIMINGTEPILKREYLESYKENDQDYILTNGLALINDDNLTDQLLKNGIKRISISYHFGIHEKISSVSTKKIETLVKRLREKCFDVRLLTTISKSNYMNIVEYCDLAYKMGANTIKFTNYINQGEAKKHQEFDYTLNEDELISFFEQIKDARQKYNAEDFLIQRCGSFGPDISNNNSKKFVCPAVNDNVVLTPNGDVYPCIFLIDEEHKIGYYNEKIYVDYNKIKNNGDKCLAYEYCNKKK
jgi:MoaA/NifB/PqqE/SkfB family radical SAM enzyme